LRFLVALDQRQPKEGGYKLLPFGDHMPTEPHRVDDPEYWRLIAKNTRALATETKDQSAKKILEDVAASYERLAALAESDQRVKPTENS